jgi:hypothetical protein
MKVETVKSEQLRHDMLIKQFIEDVLSKHTIATRHVIDKWLLNRYPHLRDKAKRSMSMELVYTIEQRMKVTEKKESYPLSSDLVQFDGEIVILSVDELRTILKNFEELLRRGT